MSKKLPTSPSLGPSSGCEAASVQAWKGEPREKRKWRPGTLRSLQITRQALNSAFPTQDESSHVGGRALSLRSPRWGCGAGRLWEIPGASACALPASRCFRFSVSSQSGSFSVPAEFPESTWCGSSQQPPPSRRSLLTARAQRP